MGTNLTKPSIYGTEREQIARLHRYLIKLVDELQVAFDALEGKEHSGAAATVPTVGIPSGVAGQEIFNGIKALIARSTEIADALEKRLSEKYILTLRESAAADTVRESGTEGDFAWRIWQSGRAEVFGTATVTPETPAQEYGVLLPIPILDAVTVCSASGGVSVSPLRIRNNTVTVRTASPDEAIGTKIKIHLIVLGHVTQKGE